MRASPQGIENCEARGRSLTLPWEPKIWGASITVRGNFNPSIFQPMWYAKQKLVGDEAAENAEIEVIHSTVSKFEMDKMAYTVTGDAFQIQAQDITLQSTMVDIVKGTFRILEHVPIRQFGLNSFRHFQMDSEAQWNSIGDYFAPKRTWQKILEKPGMRSLVIEGQREGSAATRTQIKLEPSVQVKYGVFIHFNEHYDLVERLELEGFDAVKFLLDTVENSWDDSVKYCDESSLYILRQSLKGSK